MRSFTVSFLIALVAQVQLKEHAASNIGDSDAATHKLVDMFVDRFLDRVLTSFPASRSSATGGLAIKEMYPTKAQGLPVHIDNTTLRIQNNYGVMPRQKGRWERARRNYFTAPENGWENTSFAEITEMYNKRQIGWRGLRSLPEYPGGPWMSVHTPVSREDYIKQREAIPEKGIQWNFLRGTSWNEMGLMGPKWPRAPPEEAKEKAKTRTKATRHRANEVTGMGGVWKPKWMLKEEEIARLQEIEDKKKADEEYKKRFGRSEAGSNPEAGRRSCKEGH